MIETIEFILTDERFYAPLTPLPDDNAVPVSNIIRLLSGDRSRWNIRPDGDMGFERFELHSDCDLILYSHRCLPHENVRTVHSHKIPQKTKRP
jgi:hypothetical protein